MDVPIALAVTLSYAMSLYETIGHGEHAWFDATVTLPAHRPTLDHMMRGRARSAIRPRTVIAAWRDSPACRRLAGISRRQ